MAATATAQEVKVGPRTFQIRGTLGRGGFSVVYAGSDSETSKKVALKMMFDVKPDENDATYKQTCDEIKMMRKLQHRNLIKLLGYDLHATFNARPCVILVQELAPNRELFEYLLHSKSTFGERLVMYVMNQVLDAIAFMHSKGVAHRDLKPENILLDKEFTVKIADFGFAKYFFKHDQRMKMRTELGTRGYMAPEISRNAAEASRANRRSYDEKVDTFALGVILFICASGFPPFRQTNSEDWWFDKIMKEHWNFFWKAHERKHEFSPLVKDLIQNMLAHDSSKRLSPDECMKHPFFTNNPAGKMMTKEDYIKEMKGRYKHVKEALRAINEARRDTSRDEVMPLQENADILKEYENSSLPATLLCMNDIRKSIFEIEDPTDDAGKGKLSQLLASTLVDIAYPSVGARQQHDIIADFRKFYETKSLEELATIKHVFCNGKIVEDFQNVLPSSDIDAKSVRATLNNCLLGTLASTEISMESVLQYAEFDQADLCLIDPAKLNDNEGLIFNVKYGFGTFVHFMKELHEKTPTVTIDVEMGAATVNYEIADTMVLGEEEVTVTDHVQILLQMYAIDRSTSPDAPSGFAIAVRSAGYLQTHLHAFDMCWKRMLTESDFLHPLLVNQKA